MERTLYNGNRNASSWGLRAWLALKEQNIQFSDIIIDLRRPQRWKNLEEIGLLSPVAAVPVLVDNGDIIFDSLAIMEYANEVGQGTLLPDDPVVRAQVRAYVAWQHSTFSRICPCLSFESTFYPEKKKLTADEVTAIARIYALWDETITKFGGDYLFGAYSLADIAFVPSVLRLSSHFAADKRWPKTAAWFEALLSRPHVAEWIADAEKEAPIYLPGYYGDV